MIQVFTGLIMLGVMFAMSVKLTVLVLAGLVIYVANYKWLVPRIRRLQRRYRRKIENLSGMAQERLAGAIVVKSFGSERVESRNFVRKNFTAERVFHRYRMLNLSYSILSSLTTWGTFSLVILLGTLQAVRGEITYGTVTAVTAFAFRLLVPAAMLAELSSQLQQGRVSLDRIFSLIHGEADLVDKGGKKLPELRGQVSFENINFEYEPQKPVLRNFSLSVPAGKTVALVGQTGCGKSTLVNLLYRFYEADSGNVKVDGHDIKSFETRWYRKQLAIVPQDPIIFEATMAENIAYGQPKATREQILKAARMVELGGVVDRLDRGLDTYLGDRGAKLSVGEKQRICIARAILSEPAILILDEATSSLDTRNEAMIQLAMKRVMANRTCFVVAHRLSTIINADMIVVMDGGRVAESGNHTQLMLLPQGKYKQLYLTQTASMPRAKIV